VCVALTSIAMSTALLLSDSEPQLEDHRRDDGFEIVAGPWGRPDVVIAEDEGEIERWRGQTPVIVLGREQADSVERVRAFRRGCDDYVRSA
jgi:DNA-binding response OmpR family regulator